jgi:hypothetical protein
LIRVKARAGPGLDCAGTVKGEAHVEYPAHAARRIPGEAACEISALKVSNAHFAKLMADYDAVNDKVHRPKPGSTC